MGPELVSITAAGMILLTLNHGKHTYSELRLETGLSDRWLSIKLEELEQQGAVEKGGRWYSLRGKSGATAYELSLYLEGQARRMADELAKLDRVGAIILFGSVARREAREYSDLDMVIVVDVSLKEAVVSEISRLESSYHITVEPLILSRRDFMANLRSKEGGIIYGMAEGYEILCDKTGEYSRLLEDRIEEIRRSHEYVEEARAWVRVR